MNVTYKKFITMICAAAITAATATAASASAVNDSVSDIDNIPAVYSVSEIPDMNVVTLDSIPEIKAQTGYTVSTPALSVSTKKYETGAELIPDIKNVIVLSNIPDLDVKTEIKGKPAAPLAASAEIDTPDTPDAPETSDEPETNDEPKLKETTSPLENLPEEFKQKLFGDVDFDGVITSNDALLALRMPFFTGTLPVSREVSDVDGDGVITSADALEILRNANGLSDKLTAENIVEGVKWLIDNDGEIYGVIAGGWDAAGIVNINGYVCGFDESSKMLTGEAVINGQKYIFTENGVLLNGWVKTDEGMKLYRNGFAAEGFVTVYDQTFYFENNIAAVGWKDIGEKHCYFDENGIAAEGFVDIDGKTYYFGSDLDNKTGFIEVAGSHYMMYENGGFAQGWTNVGNERYYFTESGAAAKGWTEIDGIKYYFVTETQLALGEYKIGADKYFFGEDGKFLTGFVSTDKGTIYNDDFGFTQYGFNKIDGDTYYFGDNGIMAVGETKIDGATYVFDENGVMKTGWTWVSGFKAYLIDDWIAKGALKIDGVDYYFEDDGTLRSGLFKKNGDLYYKGSTGIYQKGFVTVGSDTYYFGSDFKAVTDFQTIDGKLYCFGSDYKMLKNTKVGLYRINEDGVCIKLTTVDASTVKYKADDIIEQVGKDPAALCRYVYNHMSYYFVNEPMVYSNPYNADWGSIAAFGMNRGYGACYHYSSFLAVLFQRAGYTSRIIVGTGYYPSLHSFNQLYINGEWLTYDALYATCGASTGYMNSLGYTYNHFINYTF